MVFLCLSKSRPKSILIIVVIAILSHNCPSFDEIEAKEKNEMTSENEKNKNKMNMKQIKSNKVPNFQNPKEKNFMSKSYYIQSQSIFRASSHRHSFILQ